MRAGKSLNENLREGSTSHTEKECEVTKRRAEWNYSEGMKPKGEWVDLAGGRVFCLEAC